MESTRFDRFLAFITTLSLTFCLTYFPLMCLVTAYALPASSGLIAAAALTAGLWLCAVTVPKDRFIGWMILLWGCLFLGIWIFLSFPSLTESCKALYTAVSGMIAAPYGLELPAWAPVREKAAVTAALTVWTLVPAAITVWSVHGRHSIFPALVIDSLPLALCLILVDTPPRLSWLLAYLCAALVLVLTQSSRSRSLRDGSRLVPMALACTLALVLGLHTLLPMEGYKRGGSGQVVLGKIVNIASGFTQVDVDSLGALDIRMPIADTENLNVGPRRDSSATVLQIKCGSDGPFYLRGTAYAEYTGHSWKMLDESAYEGLDTGIAGLVPFGIPLGDPMTLEIHSRTIHPAIYTPYYMTEIQTGLPHLDTYISNEDGIQSYTLTYYEAVADALLSNYYPLSQVSEGYADFVPAHYTALPEDTRLGLLELAEKWGLDEGTPPQEVANVISRTAEYSLNTPKKPQDSDFVLWFLQEADTGYCIHYASAVTAMLRALGHPARYVTGYLVETKQDQWTNVSSKSGHAWCEIFDADLGWVPVEATPSDGLNTTMSPPEATALPTQATRPPTTAPTIQTIPPTTRPHAAEPSIGADPGGHHLGPISQERTPTSLHIHIPASFWWFCLFAALFVLRRPVTRKIRAALWEGQSKTAYLRRWNAARKLARYVGKPGKLKALAQKAKYSQHEMSEADWDAMKAWELELQIAVLNLPGWHRFLIRWILIAD